jgi:Na+-driven multidrug efflux pump
VASTLTLLLLIFGGAMIRLFTDTPAIINLGLRQIRILAIGYIAMSVMQIFSGILRGAGDTMPSMWISILIATFIRLPLAYLLAYLTRSVIWPNGSPDALFFSLLAAWTLSAVLTYSWYRRGRWREKCLVESLAARS